MVYILGSRGWKLELVDIYRGQSGQPPPTVRLPNTPRKFEALIFFFLFCSFPFSLLGNKRVSSLVEEMPEDRFTTLPSGGFFVETQISDNKGWDRASSVSYLDPTIYPPSNNLPKRARQGKAGRSSLGGQGSYSGCLHWQGEVRPSDRRCRHKSQSGEVALAATPNTSHSSSSSPKFWQLLGFPFDICPAQLYFDLHWQELKVYTTSFYNYKNIWSIPL